MQDRRIPGYRISGVPDDSAHPTRRHPDLFKQFISLTINRMLNFPAATCTGDKPVLLTSVS
jgi:hypothetical protein